MLLVSNNFHIGLWSNESLIMCILQREKLSPRVERECEREEREKEGERIFNRS